LNKFYKKYHNNSTDYNVSDIRKLSTIAKSFGVSTKRFDIGDIPNRGNLSGEAGDPFGKMVCDAVKNFNPNLTNLLFKLGVGVGQ